MKHSVDTEIFVNVGPMDAFAAADDLKIAPLGGRCVT
jgi:hypothetical protein